MADFSMDNYAKLAQVPPVMADGGQYGGRVRCYRDQIATVAASHLAGSRIFAGRLMPCEIFLGGTVVFPAHTTAATIKFGDADDDDRYLAAASVAAAGKLDLLKIDGFGYRNDTNLVVPLFFTTAGQALADAAVGLKVVYFVGLP